ncbi:hypothetical protein MACJ_004170 (apicoplast) [Theileria orientalis]|uniref:Uncharacterized protein n=1 Tax=Theileria orientalis TaxID=68886 RepID=A0A976XJM5_THEOR|nr:hypothetical protein MACJ_004170 [Theileria orientalis]
MKNINTSNKIINIINFNDKINYLQIITNLNVCMLTIICKFYYNFIYISSIYLEYNDNMFKILKSLNSELILYTLNYKFKKILILIYNFIDKINLFSTYKVLQIIKINNIIENIKELYNNNKNNIKLNITLLNYYINKINLNNLLKNKILKIMNIYDNKLTITKLNYYSTQLKFLKLKILDLKLNLNKSIINYLNLKIYSYLFLLLLYMSSITIPLALIAFP